VKGELSLVAGRRRRHTHRLALANELLMQVYTTDAKTQFSLQHAEKVAHMVDGLGERVGYEANSTISQIGERASAGFVAGMQRKTVDRGVIRAQPERARLPATRQPADQPIDQAPPKIEPFSLPLGKSPKNVIVALISRAQRGAEQYAVSEFQLL
jgi:hypothetical protein